MESPTSRMKSIKVILKSMLVGCGLDARGSGQDKVVDSCDNCTKTWGNTPRE